MQKVQVPFPDAMMRVLRKISEAEERPLSEIVRRAVDEHLSRRPAGNRKATHGRARFPVFRGGRVLVSADRLKEVVHEDDAA